MSFSIPARLDTELDAVNTVLAAKGLAMATTVDTSDLEVSKALKALADADLEVQSAGLACNSDEALSLTPNVSGEIVLPDQTISVANAYWPSYNGSKEARVVQRANKLYDITNQTFQFEAAFEVDIIVRLPYEDLPQPTRRYIATLAAHRSQGKGQMSQGVVYITREEVTRTQALHEQNEDREKPKNSITGNSVVMQVLHGGGVTRRMNWSY